MGALVASAIYALIDLVNGAAGAVIGLLGGYGIDPFPMLGLLVFVVLILQYAL